MVRKNDVGNYHEEVKESILKQIVSNIISFFKVFLICFILVHIMMNYIIRPIHVVGDSMSPTLKNGQYAISCAFIAKFLTIQRGDIVIAYDDKMFHEHVIKRVIAVPNDRIYCEDDQVYINGEVIDEPYLKGDLVEVIRSLGESFTEDFQEITLGEDEYWLMGDNRQVSKDSRDVGAFKKSQIKASGIFRVFPVTNIGIVK